MKLLGFAFGEVAIVVVLLGTAAGGVSQVNKGGASSIPQSQTTQTIGDASRSSSGRIDMDVGPLSSGIEEKQSRTRNSERQKRLTADTKRLLSLAEELKQEMDKPDTGAGSVDQARKAEEIEKLARSVRDHMRG